MAIPTSGVTAATAWSPSPAWNNIFTLIGDSESLIAENASGETATLNRMSKQLAANALWLYNLQYHSATSEGIYMPGAGSDFNSVLAFYRNKYFRFKLTLTLQENLTLNAAYPDYFNFSNLFGMDEIEIDLNSKTISVLAGYPGATYLFDFQKVNVPLLTLKDGSISDASGNITSLIGFNNCTGMMVCDNLTTSLTAFTNHYDFIGTRGIVKNSTLARGLNGIYARNISYVMSQDNSNPVTACASYGLVSISGSTIRKYDATQPSGTSGAELATTGGSIS